MSGCFFLAAIIMPSRWLGCFSFFYFLKLSRSIYDKGWSPKILSSLTHSFLSRFVFNKCHDAFYLAAIIMPSRWLGFFCFFFGFWVFEVKKNSDVLQKQPVLFLAFMHVNYADWACRIWDLNWSGSFSSFHFNGMWISQTNLVEVWTGIVWSGRRV